MSAETLSPEARGRRPPVAAGKIDRPKAGPRPLPRNGIRLGGVGQRHEHGESAEVEGRGVQTHEEPSPMRGRSAERQGERYVSAVPERSDGGHGDGRPDRDEHGDQAGAGRWGVEERRADGAHGSRTRAEAGAARRRTRPQAVAVAEPQRRSAEDHDRGAEAAGWSTTRAPATPGAPGPDRGRWTASDSGTCRGR